MKKKTLTLNVSKQWFDMIVTGEKTEVRLMAMEISDSL